MGVLESVRGVLWARRRQPDDVAYVASLGHERFPPADLLGQAVVAEQAGFDGVCCSDHLSPWWVPTLQTPASCGNAWVWLGAAGQATQRVALGTGVTSLAHRYNPVVLAQQVATLEAMCPGRAFLGVGSGEAMNEVPAGLDWPPVEEQLARAEESLQILTRLLDGETVTHRGDFFRVRDARLYLAADRRPPVFMSAFGPQAAEIAGRYADGIWTLADPRRAPSVIAAYRRSCEEAGRQPGEVILQGPVAWAENDDVAYERAQEWKPTLVDANYAEDNHTPEQVDATASQVSDTTFKMMGIISADPSTHVRKIKAIRELGATVVVLMNISGAAPEGTLRVYGEQVLPRLRD